MNELAHILEGVADVPENLQDIAQATKQVVQVAQVMVTKVLPLFYKNSFLRLQPVLAECWNPKIGLP